MRSLLLAVLWLTAGCFDESALQKKNTAEERMKEKILADGRINKGAPLPSGTLKEFDEDAGVAEAAMPTSIAEDAKVTAAGPDNQGLVRAWAAAKTGDYLVVQCGALADKFGNRVLRRVQLRLEVVAQDDASVVLRVRGRGSEEHNSNRRDVKRKQWSQDFTGAGELVMARTVDGKLGAPQPARSLGPVERRALQLGKTEVDAACSKSGALTEKDQKERCIAAEPSLAFLSAGLLSESTPLQGNSCQVVEIGNAPPSRKLRIDVSASEYVFSERGGKRFRDRAVAAAAGVVKLEVQRLAFARSPKPGTVTVDGKSYLPDVVDARRLQLLDWALQRVMPEFPVVLPVD